MPIIGILWEDGFTDLRSQVEKSFPAGKREIGQVERSFSTGKETSARNVAFDLCADTLSPERP
jgi:hypothetical protein